MYAWVCLLFVVGIVDSRDRSGLTVCFVQGKHMPADSIYFGLAMSEVDGAAVLPRPGLTNLDKIWPANSLDFVKTLQAYFPLFRSSLLAR